MNICIIACCKHEELYIREWIDWHKLLGITHIYLCDNNESTYPNKISDVIKDHINDNYVTIIDYNDVHPIQPHCYDDVYQKYGDLYDWILIIDIDEFLHIPETNNDIKRYVLLYKFRFAYSISINWVYYGDNDKLYYEPYPVQERFNKPSLIKGVSDISKSLFRGKSFYSQSTIDAVHDCLSEKIILKNPKIHNRVNTMGIRKKKCTILKWLKEECVLSAHIKHYLTKSIEEYAYRNLRGDTLKEQSDKDYPYKLTRFFVHNTMTQLKKDIFNKIINESSTYNNRKP